MPFRKSYGMLTHALLLGGAVVALCVELLVFSEAEAQQPPLPASMGVIAPNPPPMPIRPLPYSPFGYYDLLAGFRPVYLGAPQPTGHQIVATGPNGYVYRPVYDMQGTMSLPGAPLAASVTASPAGAAEMKSAVEDFQTGRYERALMTLQKITNTEPANGFAWLLASHSQFALEQFADASASLRQALTMLPQSDWGRILDHYRDYYRATRYTVHLRALEGFVAAHPADQSAHLLLGYHFGYLGYQPQAVQQLTQATTESLSRKLLVQFRGQPVTTPVGVLRNAPPHASQAFPPPAPEVLEPAASAPRAF